MAQRFVRVRHASKAEELYLAGLLWWARKGQSDYIWFDPDKYGWIEFDTIDTRGVGYMVED